MNTLVLNIPEADLHAKEFWNCQQEIYRQVQLGEEQVLIKVLTAFLGKYPTEEDYKKCEMIYRAGVTDKYGFRYDGILLGHVSKFFIGLTYNVTFTPVNK